MHQRSLEVYEEVFRIIGIEGLKRDLHLWSSGLFPFFQYAATASRPTVLALYERYYLPLGRDSLRAITKALALALLPGLEESTGDFFDGVAKLLDRLAVVVDQSFLNQALFLALMTNPSARVSIVNYITGRLSSALLASKAVVPTSSDSPCLTEVIGPDGGLFIRGLAAALEDDNVLVRRGILDLLVTAMPLGDFVAYPDFSSQDRLILVRAAMSVLLRKDLSLARRLYTWLLGKSEESSAQRAHFVQYGLDIVADSLTTEMTQIRATPFVQAASSLRPFKVFVSLLDKWEIGSALSERITHDSLALLQRAYEDALQRNPSSDADTIAITTRSICDAVEPFAVWSPVYRSWRITREPGLAKWLLTVCTTHDVETSDVHLPLLLRASILDYSEQGAGDLSLASLITEISQARMRPAKGSDEAKTPSLEDIDAFYSLEGSEARSEWIQKHLDSRSWDSALLGDSIRALQRALDGNDAQAIVTLLQMTTRIFHRITGARDIGPIPCPMEEWIKALERIVDGHQALDSAVFEQTTEAVLAAAQAPLDPPFVLAGHTVEERILQTVSWKAVRDVLKIADVVSTFTCAVTQSARQWR